MRAAARLLSCSRKATGLSLDEKHFLQQNGYLLIRNFLSQEKTSQIEQRMGKLLHDFDPSSTTSVFRTNRQKTNYDDQYFLTSGDKVRFFWEPDAFDENGKLKYRKEDCVNKIGHALHLHDQLFEDYVFGDLRKTVFDVGYQQPIPLQTMYICKSQRTGGEVGPHQDSTFLYTEPLSCHGFWLSVHAANQHNGCLWVIPGSHTFPLYQLFTRTTDEQQNVSSKLIPFEMPESATLPTAGGVPVETAVGDLVILHGKVVHWSHANKSSHSRHSFMTHVIEGSARYPTHNWLQYPHGSSFRPY